MDPLAVILVASFSALLSLGVGGIAIRMLLGNKLMTIGNHNEHVQQWRDQVEGLRARLADQETSHRAERERANDVAERRITEAKEAADDRVSDRDAQLLDSARERERLLHALALSDESYRAVTEAQRHGTESALRLVHNMLRASPLLDDGHPGLVQVVNSDGPAEQTGTGRPPGD